MACSEPSTTRSAPAVAPLRRQSLPRPEPKAPITESRVHSSIKRRRPRASALTTDRESRCTAQPVKGVHGGLPNDHRLPTTDFAHQSSVRLGVAGGFRQSLLPGGPIVVVVVVVVVARPGRPPPRLTTRLTTRADPSGGGGPVVTVLPGGRQRSRGASASEERPKPPGGLRGTGEGAPAGRGYGAQIIRSHDSLA
eukprot:834428-Prorocentrum_minimum.AAC.1